MKMFSSFKTLMLFLFTAVLVITAVAFMYFTAGEVDSTVTGLGRQSARNVLHVVALDIENNYQGIEFFKRYALKKYKDELENLVGIVTATIDHCHDTFTEGILSEEDAKNLALKGVQKLRYGNNNYFFIYDDNCVAISHPDPEIYGHDMSSYKDLKGNSVLKTMWEETQKHGKGFSTFWWWRLGSDKLIQKLTYFVYYPKWKWLIGTGVYIDDIETDAEEKLASTIDNLRKTLPKVKVAETGYFFIFNGEKKFLIHPGDSGSAYNGKESQLIEKLILFSRSPDTFAEYLWDKPDRPGIYDFSKEAYVEYFPSLDWYIGSSVYRDEMERPARMIIKKQILFVGIILLIGLFITFLLVTRMTRPLRNLASYADYLSENDFSPDAKMTDMLDSITFPAEMRSLAGTISNMQGRLQEYITKITETTAANASLRSELRIAHDIQMSMLPGDSDRIFKEKNIELAAKLIPAREVGGDFYDYCLVDDNKCCFVIGDVSGKGVPAALFMALSKALIRSAVENRLSPAGIMSKANHELCQINDALMFVTIFLGIMDLNTGETEYSNAGHNPPYIVPSSGICHIVDLPKGKPLGISEKSSYKDMRMVIDPGDLLFIYTDGVTEAEDPEHNLFSEKRLERFLSTADNRTPEKLIEDIIHTVASFSNSDSPSDDITVMALKLINE